MTELFFESPFNLYLGLGVIEFPLILIWFARRGRIRLVTLLVPPVLAGIIALVAHLVVTDREQIIAVTEDIARAVESGQTQRIAGHIDEQFTGYLHGMLVRKKELVAVCNISIEKWGISKIALHKMDVEVSSPKAKMHVNTIITYGAHGGGRAALIWNTTWIKRGKKWFVFGVQEPRTGFEL